MFVVAGVLTPVVDKLLTVNVLSVWNGNSFLACKRIWAVHGVSLLTNAMTHKNIAFPFFCYICMHGRIAVIWGMSDVGRYWRSKYLTLGIVTHCLIHFVFHGGKYGPVFYLWPSRVLTNERGSICNIFSHWSRPCSGIDKRNGVDKRHSISRLVTCYRVTSEYSGR